MNVPRERDGFTATTSPTLAPSVTFFYFSPSDSHSDFRPGFANPGVCGDKTWSRFFGRVSPQGGLPCHLHSWRQNSARAWGSFEVWNHIWRSFLYIIWIFAGDSNAVRPRSSWQLRLLLEAWTSPMWSMWSTLTCPVTWRSTCTGETLVCLIQLQLVMCGISVLSCLPHIKLLFTPFCLLFHEMNECASSSNSVNMLKWKGWGAKLFYCKQAAYFSCMQLHISLVLLQASASYFSSQDRSNWANG